MRILIYSEYFFPIPGGVQTIVFELARRLAEWATRHPDVEPFEVIVVTRTRERTAEDDSWPFRLVRCPSLRQLLELLRASDVIHLAGPALLPMTLSLALRKPVVIEHHGFHAACPNGLLFFEPKQSPCPGHFSAKRYDKCLTCNRSTVGSVKSFWWLAMTPVRRWLSNRASRNVMPTDWLGTILRLNRMTTIHHGVPNALQPATQHPSNSIFAFQGRVVTTKGAGVLLDATRLLRNQNYQPTLRIIGDGPELGSLKSGSAGLAGQVEFCGHVGSEHLEEALSSAATVVMPSLGGEVFGLVAAENMMRGKLLIISDLGALTEVVGSTGLSFPAKDSEALAGCMRQVLENPGLAHLRGEAARERAMQMFNQDSMIQAHVSLYQEVVGH